MTEPLRGVGWRHTRAMAPLHALAELLWDRHGEEVVRWDTRSLKSFAEDPLDRFDAEYDLIVFDYPFAGEALASGWLHPLDRLLPPETLAARREGCVGRAYDSFLWNGSLAALPIDAAAYVRAWRPDLLDRRGRALPEDWESTVALAWETGAVAMPLTPTAVWGDLITLCASRGAPPLRAAGPAFDRDAALAAFADLARLVAHLPAWCFDSSPVAILNRMSEGDDIAYCPLTYGYSTYAMAGYARHRLSFGDPAIVSGEVPDGVILGGAGIGVSARSKRPEEAAGLAAWLTSDEVQATFYAQTGGQPAAAAAWNDPLQDALAGGFYSGTRASIDRAYHRPNGPGFHAFQTRSVNRLHAALREGADPSRAFDAIDDDWAALPR